MLANQPTGGEGRLPFVGELAGRRRMGRRERKEKRWVRGCMRACVRLPVRKAQFTVSLVSREGRGCQRRGEIKPCRSKEGHHWHGARGRVGAVSSPSTPRRTRQHARVPAWNERRRAARPVRDCGGDGEAEVLSTRRRDGRYHTVGRCSVWRRCRVTRLQRGWCRRQWLARISRVVLRGQALARVDCRSYSMQGRRAGGQEGRPRPARRADWSGR